MKSRFVYRKGVRKIVAFQLSILACCGSIKASGLMSHFEVFESPISKVSAKAVQVAAVENSNVGPAANGVPKSSTTAGLLILSGAN